MIVCRVVPITFASPSSVHPDCLRAQRTRLPIEAWDGRLVEGVAAVTEVAMVCHVTLHGKWRHLRKRRNVLNTAARASFGGNALRQRGRADQDTPEGARME